MVGEVRDETAAIQSILPDRAGRRLSEQDRRGRLASTGISAQVESCCQCGIGVQSARRHDALRDCIGARSYPYDIRGAGAKSQGLEAYNHPPRAGVATGRIDRGGVGRWIKPAFAE